MTKIAAVIVDVVGSRRLEERARAQNVVRAAFAHADDIVPPLTPLWATFADEFQAMYATAEQACAATGIARLAMAEGFDVRAGIGIGTSVEVEPGATGPVLDGDAWWNARAAIDEAERRAGRSGTARTWVLASTPFVSTDSLNSALVMRDHVIGTMRPREKRIAAALIAGQTQERIAGAEGITQSAVSQSARRSGALALEQATSLWLST